MQFIVSLQQRLKIFLFVTEINPRTKSILPVSESLLEDDQSLRGELQGLKRDFKSELKFLFQ